jgi:Zn-dependent alcohol dehydrogenase
MSKERNIGDVMNTVLTGANSSVVLSTTAEVGILVCNGAVLPSLLRFAAQVANDLGLSLKDATGIKDKLLSKVDDVSFILNLIANYADTVYELVGAMSTLRTAAAVKELGIDDLIKVTVRVVEVNRDFFTNRVLPQLQGAKTGQTL